MAKIQNLQHRILNFGFWMWDVFRISCFGFRMYSLLLCFSAAPLLLGAPDVFAAEARPGVLVLAHGGNEAWNASVRDAVTLARIPYPTDIAYGMGMHAQDVAQIRDAVARLQAQGVTELLVLPLLISSHSDVYRQYEYLFGFRRVSPWPKHAPPPLTLHLPVRFSAPLDGHPYVAETALDRARHLSANPAQEIVLLVAHGPNGDRDNEAWLMMMRSIALVVQQQGHFARVEVQTLRDDASWFVRHRATRALRRLVKRDSRTHHVLIVPLLIARGGIEEKIPRRLHGLTFAYTGETLLPHPRVAAWMHDAVEHTISTSQPAKWQPVGVRPGT